MMSDSSLTPHHHRRAALGRNVAEQFRAASPLELLFDLTFVIAVAQSAAGLANYYVEGDYKAALVGFIFTMFGAIWAWINISWYCSAYDTDDWIHRFIIGVQMIGVLILAMGIPATFESIQHERFDNRVMVLGYVVMRVMMLAHWSRAWRDDPQRRRTITMYMLTLIVAQIGWVWQIFLHLDLQQNLLVGLFLILIEVTGPIIAERKGGTPWNAAHIAERYSCLVIITLGEAIVGTFAAIQSAVDSQGWSWQVAVAGLAGMLITFGLWWNYFDIPFGELLTLQRNKTFGFGSIHIPVFMSIAAIGGGLNVMASSLRHETTIGTLPTVMATAVPVTIFLALLYAMYTYFMGKWDPLHAYLLAGTVLVLGLGIAMAMAGVSTIWCVVTITLAPAVSIIGYEVAGHQAQVERLEEIRRESTS